MSQKFTVHRSVRPLRLAFVVQPGDWESLRWVIQMNTVIWGGRYNLILPAYKRLPKALKRSGPYAPRDTAKSVFEGFFKTFEPDYLVQVRGASGPKIGFPEERTITCDQVLDKRSVPSETFYSCCATHIYQRLYFDRYQFVLRDEKDSVVLPEHSPVSILTQALYGEFPTQDSFGHVAREYQEVFKPKTYKPSPSNIFTSLHKGCPLKIGSAFLEKSGHGMHRYSSGLFFYFDESDWNDVVEFWNLRAFGVAIFPIPKNWSNELLEPVREYALKNFEAGRHQELNIVSSRSSSAQTEVGEFHESLRLMEFPRFSLPGVQKWYPPIWDKSYIDSQGPRRVNLNSHTRDPASPVDSSSFYLRTPEFVDEHRNSAWANIVDITSSSFWPGTAAVIPSSLQRVASVFQLYGPGEIWTSEEGVVITKTSDSSPLISLNQPTGANIFQHWMSERSQKMELSAAGKIASRMLFHLEDPRGIKWLAYPEILKKLDKMASNNHPGESATANHKAWVGLAKRVVERRFQNAYLSRLIEKKVLKVGLELQCHTCSRRNWYSLQELAETLHCRHCLETLPFPSHDPPKESWSYRTLGPFTVENYAQGAYTVLLALRFFYTEISRRLTWSPSFLLKTQKPTKTELEVDFGIFLPPERNCRNKPSPNPLLGECKSFGTIQKSDVDKMRILAHRFPGSAIVFCTLKNGLSVEEKKLLKAIAQRGRQKSSQAFWKTPVIVLTGTELFSSHSIRQTWHNAGGKQRKLVNEYSADILSLSDVTQQLYLDLPSFLFRRQPI